MQFRKGHYVQFTRSAKSLRYPRQLLRFVSKEIVEVKGVRGGLVELVTPLAGYQFWSAQRLEQTYPLYKRRVHDYALAKASEVMARGRAAMWNKERLEREIAIAIVKGINVAEEL